MLQGEHSQHFFVYSYSYSFVHQFKTHCNNMLHACCSLWSFIYQCWQTITRLKPCCPCQFWNQLDHVSNQPNCVVAASWMMITTTATLSYYLDTPECINAITLFNLSNLYRVVEPNTTVTVHHNVTRIQVCARGLSIAHGDIQSNRKAF